MTGQLNLISGEGFPVNVSTGNKFTIYRYIIKNKYSFIYARENKMNVRSHELWQKVLKAKEDIKYLAYEQKQAYINELQKEYYVVFYDCSPTQMFFTYRLPQLIRNILHQIQKGGIRFNLNEFDRVPENFAEYSEADKLYYLIDAKFIAQRASESLREILYLEGGIYRPSTKSFHCTLSEAQARYLCRILKKAGFLDKDQSSFEFIYYLQDGPISLWPMYWKTGTETLLYFFYRLFMEKYIVNYDWHIVISKHRYTFTKTGNRLNYSNVTTSLHNIKSGKSKLKDKKRVDSLLKKLKFFGDPYLRKH